MKALKTKLIVKKLLSLAPMLIVTASLLFAVVSYSSSIPSNSDNVSLGQIRLDGCGGNGQSVTTSINFGCSHSGNPITDLIFAIIRFLSAGVGLVIILSIIVGGIQYILSRGNPSATSSAINRLVSSIIALVIFIFAYAILNYLIPGGFFK